MSLKTKYIVSLSIALSFLLVLTGILFTTNQGLAYQIAEMAEFSTTISNDRSDGSASVPLKVVGPARAKVGDTVTFTVMGDGATDLAGFEFMLQYDTAGLIFSKADVSDDLTSLDADILRVGPVRNGNTVHFGVLTCPVADCTSNDYQQPRLESGVDMANVPLINFYFQVRSGGSYSLSLNSAQLVKSDGTYLLPGDQKPLVQSESISVDALDLTHNGFINDSDVWSAVGIWADLTEQGRCTTPALAYYDIDQSGCIDIADMQLILSHWGEPTSRFLNRGTSPSAVDATFTVNSDGDSSDDTLGNGICDTGNMVGDSPECTLRAAIEESNTLPGRDTINFNVRNQGGQCPALVVIQPATTMIVDDPAGNGVTIDGYTQCDASANTEPVDGNAVIKVEIQGNQTEGFYGLQVSSENNTVKGLAVYDWNYQILFRGARAQNNTVEGCFIGTNAANTHETGFVGENDGMRIDWGASNNIVGGGSTDWAKRNLISGNDQDGLAWQGPDVMGNVATGNYIGLKQDGVTKLRNNADGVDIAGGAHNNRVGGLNPGDRNVIGGNNRDGVEISHDSVNNNEIVGNFIGLNATGSQITLNLHKGVTFEDVTPENKVYRNVIAGNGGYGVRFYTASDSEVSDNFIGVYPVGLGPTDVVPVPNTISLADLVPAPNGAAPLEDEGLSGVYMIGGSQNNLILRNIIAYHPNDGIHLSAAAGYLAPDPGTCFTYFNTFSQNRIFDNGREGIRFSPVDCDGTLYYPNQNIQSPMILSATTALVSGTACANCTVEVFIADKTLIQDPGGDNNGEGKVYLATGTTDGSGNFSIPVMGVGLDDLITATATDTSGNTSKFARNIQVGGEPMPTDTPTPTGTITPTDTPTATPTATPKPPVVGGPYIISLPLVVRQAP